QEGMDTEHRRRVLGDSGPNKPETWDWGNRTDVPGLHVLLMLYAADEGAVRQLYADQAADFAGAGPVEKKQFGTIHPGNPQGQFGFRDGIAQPFVRGVRKEPPLQEVEAPVPENTINPGEILLGYLNEYGKLPLSPTVPAPDGGSLDFGRN